MTIANDMRTTQFVRNPIPWFRLKLGGSLMIQNLIWNYAGLFWLSALSIISVSLYVRILGSQNWGLVSACVSLQIVFNVLDMGFSQIAPKWFVEGMGSPTAPATYFRLFRRTYAVLAISGFTLLQLGAHPLATSWFNVPMADQSILQTSIRLIAAQFLFQFMNGLNNAIWSGRQQQRLMNLRACLFTTCRHVLAVSLLYFVAPDVRLYCAAFLVVSMLEWGTNHVSVSRIFVGSIGCSESGLARRVLGEIAILIAGVLVGTMVAQIDRITLSRTLAVREFGIYTLVLTLALALLQLQMPVTRAFFPRIVQDIRARGDLAGRTWLGLFGLTFVCVGIPAAILGFASGPVLHFWLGDEQMAASGAPVLSLLCIGVVLNAVYGCIYQILLASARNREILGINLISLMCVGVLIACWSTPFSLEFGAVVWIVIGIVQITCGSCWYLVHLRGTRAVKE